MDSDTAKTRVATNKATTTSGWFTKITKSNELVRCEPDNFDKIVLLKSGNFLVAYDNSMWFLDKLYGISNQERKIRFDEKFNRRVRWASFFAKDFPKKRKLLVENNVKQIYDSEMVIVFELPEPVPDKQVKSWITAEETIIEDVEAALFPDELKNQKVTRHLLELNEYILSAIKNDMPTELRDSHGSELLRWMSGLMSEYMELEIGRKTKDERQRLAVEFINHIQVLQLQLMSSFNARSMRSGKAVNAGGQMRAIIKIVRTKYIPKDEKATKSNGKQATLL